MTEILKCPFCGSELENACAQVIYFCPNDECHKAKDWYASKQVWQALIDGKKAQDALDVAVYALKEYEGRDSYDCDGNWCGCEHSTAHKALTKIAALEQKEQQ